MKNKPYDLKDADCILAMSGGMDCVALLHWLLKNGRKPYIFRYEFSSNKKTNAWHRSAIKKIEDYYNVKVINWKLEPEHNLNGFIDRERTKKYNQDKPRTRGISNTIPILSKWPAIAYMINFANPWIKEIHFGMCYGGLLEFNDGHSDNLYDYNDDGILEKKPAMPSGLDATNYDDRHKKLFDGYISNLKDYGIHTEFKSPIGHRTKLHLWNTLPREIQKAVVTCGDPVYNKDNTKVIGECGKCNKCRELNGVKNFAARQA